MECGCERSREPRRRRVGMEIGKPQREIYVEPLELPEPLRPTVEPEREPQREPEREPVHHEAD